MAKRPKSSLYVAIIFGMMVVGLISAIGFSAMMYLFISDAEMERLDATSQAALNPIINLATRSVNGANVMKLRNKDATSLYQSTGALYVSITGMSKKSPKTAFSAAQPPRPVNYSFTSKEINKEKLNQLLDTLKSGDERHLDENNWWYVVRQPLANVENGGTLTVRCSATGAHGVRILVKDNGPGISPEQLSSIFDPYFTTKKRGTGLGLAIVYKIIEAHQGQISVQSTQGEGTSFSITIPCRQGETAKGS